MYNTEGLPEVFKSMFQAGVSEGWNEKDFLAVGLGELWGLEANAPYGKAALALRGAASNDAEDLQPEYGLP